MRALIYFILGAILLAGGIWWIIEAGNSVPAIGAAIVTALGGCFAITGLAVSFDMFAPTSKKI